MMKIAIFHDYIEAIGGGERLVLILARALNADIITTNVDHDSIKKMGYQDIRVISLGDLARVAPFKQIHASIKFGLCKFPEYDFYIFSGNWAHYAVFRHKPNLFYCHTPVRVFYDLNDFFLKNQKTSIHRFLARVWISFHKRFDKISVKRINKIVTNSENTKNRIKKYYECDAEVVYPPILTDKFKYICSDSYWLSVNRLYFEKRVWLQIEAFRRMPDEKLKIVGWYSESGVDKRYLKFLSDLPPNVTILGSVSDNALFDLYGKCKGFISTAISEDFGMSAVEAMAAGKPVIAVNEGGYTETVVDGVTGILIEPNIESIIEAVNEISINENIHYKRTCRERAKLFDDNIFVNKMKKEIDAIIERSGKV